MLHKFFEEGDWFLPKSHGYGAGLPIAWQGWVLLGTHLLMVLGLVMWAQAERDPLIVAIAALGIILVSVLLLIVARRRTKGGWRWRWGKKG